MSTHSNEAAKHRAGNRIMVAEAAISPTTCTYCNAPFGNDVSPNVDKLHRFTPLCSACYLDPHKREVTEAVL